MGFGVRYVVPLVPDFLSRHPGVKLDLSLTDGVIDRLENRTDIAIRSGVLRDTPLKASKIWRAVALLWPRPPLSGELQYS
ncbi:LysR substrate-binding domain-containing protein [Microvirga makkahensis]|uniref:LysR substrate-binding domain-containing protein n=1 Tax=Microvirga makkahensis TaxID=1128670 RepID=UPI001FE2F7D7|nr:LysR substrate-binding domain-containing protein [Microvirga makkahensis]